MSTVIEKIVARVINDPTVSGLIGNRLTPETAGAFTLDLPRASYEVIPQATELGMGPDPTIELVTQTFRFHSYARTQGGTGGYTATEKSQEVARAIQDSLHGFVDPPVRMTLEDGSVFTGPVPDGADDLAHRIVDVTVHSN